MQGFAIVFTAIAYVSLLFAIASIGEDIAKFLAKWARGESLQ